ncbi:MAG: ABC transporter permease, partial [Mycobacteriales bacterium]
MSSFLTLSRVMALGFIRDKTAVFFTILFPLMFLILFGTLFTSTGTSKSDVAQVGKVAVLDQMPKQAKSQIKDSLKISKTNDSLDSQLKKLRDGDRDAVVTEQDGKLTLYYSQADQVRSATVRGVMQSIVQNANLDASGKPPMFTLKPQQVEDESIQPIQYQTPGLMGWAVSMSAVFGASLTLVEWRQRKILRRLRLAPTPLASVVTARVIVSIGISLLQAAIFVGVALTAPFGLQLSGQWWLAIPLIICGTLAFLGIGMVAGSFAKTAEGASGISNLIVLPMAFLSGAFFPLDDAPAWLRTISQIFPLKHMVDGTRDVFIRGSANFGTILPDMGILLAFAVVSTGIALKLFKW